MGRLDANNIAELKEKYNTPVFFETGTAYGDGVKHAMKFGFDRIISVEIMEPQYNILMETFKDVPNVELICDNSNNAILKTVPDIKENIMFWLDAHYPNADLIQGDIPAKIRAYMEGDDTIRLLLELELYLIKRLRPNNKDVIMIDDLNIYEGRIGPDAYWLRPKRVFESKFYVKIFEDSHTFVPISEMQGVLIPND